MFDVNELGQLVEGRALTRMRLQKRTNGVDHLTPPAVADCNVDDRTVDIAGSSLGFLEQPRGVIREEIEGANRVDSPACLLGEISDGVLDNADECLEFDRRTGEVVGRQEPQGDDLNPGLIAPAKKIDDLRGAGSMTRR